MLYVPTLLDKPFLLAFVDGLSEVGLSADDSCVRRFRMLVLLGLVGVVGSLVTNHVTNKQHQRAQDGKDHHSYNAYIKKGISWQG